MKALISPTEIKNYKYISAWELNDEGTLEPVYSEITGAYRVAQVSPDDAIFEIAAPLFWADCPDNCVADLWYYKDGEFSVWPEEAPNPEETPSE